MGIELNICLQAHRDSQRAQNNYKFIPVTIDELMFRFCLNEKRKEHESVWKKNTSQLLTNDISSLSEDELSSVIGQTVDSMVEMIGEDNSEFSRFRNEQNRIYLRLLE